MIKKITCEIDKNTVNQGKLTSVLNGLSKLGVLSSFEIAYDNSDGELFAEIEKVLETFLAEK